MKNNYKYSRKQNKQYKAVSRQSFSSDIGNTYPVGGRLLKVGNAELLLTKSSKTDEYGNPIYIGTIMSRSGFMKKNCTRANHILIKKFLVVIYEKETT